MLQFTERAREKILSFIAASGQGGVALRIRVAPEGASGFTYDFQLEEYGAERPDDRVVREGGFATRLDPESARWLNGATVDWVETSGATGFAVKNPNSRVAATEPDALRANIVEALRTIYDPEIPVNIYELGLIYGIDIDPERNVTVRMTLTAPNCPAAEQLPLDVRNKTQAVPGVAGVKVDLVWEPPWDKDKMSEAARLELGI
jgi:FeS assembly SUF system protein